MKRPHCPVCESSDTRAVGEEFVRAKRGIGDELEQHAMHIRSATSPDALTREINALITNAKSWLGSF